MASRTSTISLVSLLVITGGRYLGWRQINMAGILPPEVFRTIHLL